MKDITGQKFGRLTAIKWSQPSYWLFQCECGREVTKRKDQVTSGRVKSCGCLFLERAKGLASQYRVTHNMSNSKPYKIWCGIKARCHNTHHPFYKDYGGRGINICKRWERFENFYKDTKYGFEKNLTIDRINNNKGYCPENCRWVNRTIQARNRRSNREVIINGEKRCIAEWREVLGISKGVFDDRVYARGWTPEQALTTPTKSR